MMKKSFGPFIVISLILAICGCAPVTIDSVPPGAAVYKVGEESQIGTTPFDTSIFVSDKNYMLKKERYFEEPVKLNFDSPRKVEAKLRPTPVLVYSKPDAEIYAAGSDKLIARTPSKVNVGDKPITYTLKAADYYDQDISVGLESIDPTVVTLKRRPIVTISAAPEGVEVYENGKLIGPAPVREEILTTRTFELRKAGYFTQVGTLTGAPPYEVRVTLRAFPVITVSATPANAQFYRAGALIGASPIKLSVGEKTDIEVRSDRFYTQSVSLTPDSPALVDVSLKAMPYVMINSEPAGAEVLIAGKSVGTTPVEQLIEKDTAIELKKDGFVTRTATLTGADKQVTIVLEAVPAQVIQAPAAKDQAAAATSSAVTTPAKEPASDKTETKWGRLLLMVISAVVVAGLAVFAWIKRKQK
ncbi:MAG: PEGA domain-containing protein [Verrucomicrobia bacterium]|nr:PEGA domain-containing protein [Verrucomicrobiota bacterium]